MAPGTMNAKPKVVQYPNDLKTMLEKCKDQAYLAADINNKISRSHLLSLLEKVLADEGHFPTSRFTYSLDHERWNTKTVLYAITSDDANIKFNDPGKSSATKINREMKAIQSEEDWALAIKAAQETYDEETNSQSKPSKKNKKNPTLLDRQVHIIVLATKYKVKLPTGSRRKRPTPSLSSEKSNKQQKKNHFRFKMNSLLIEVHCSIALKGEKTKPNGVEKKSFSLNLFDTICPYIIKGSDSTLPSSSPNDLLTPVRDLESSSSTIASPINNDDTFSFNFSLSIFRKEVMKQGLALMLRSYKGKIGISSKLFCNQRYNKHSWNPIESTD